MSSDGLNDNQKEMDRLIKERLPAVNKLPEPNKSRSLTCLAYEYFLQDMEEEAFKLIEQAEPSYFKEQMHKDMNSIKDFDKIVLTIAAKLMESGYFGIEQEKK